jgi:CheY-like chemotaxis protein
MALEDAGGVISQAARLLGLPRHTNLHYMLKNPHKNVLAAITASSQETDLNEHLAQDSGASSQEGQAVRILHVENDDTVAGMAKEMLEIQGWQVETCVDGNTALQKISSGAHYDLLLVDYDLPGANGLELVQRTRQLAHRSRTPIIVLSAMPVEAAALKAGADEFLQKPQGVTSLVEKITRLVGTREEERQAH